MSAIIGKVAGVDITTTTAGPTGSTRVLIRGNSQLSGSNLPLYVVDGIPVDNTTIGSEPGKWGGYDYGDVLSSINPSDIESITVLKGPSASALYGSQASNGVVMITTKSAQKNKRLGVELSSSVSVVNVLTKFDDYQRVYGMGRNGDAPYDLTTATGVSQSAWGGKLDPNLQTYIYNGEMKDYGNKNNNVLSFFQTGVTYNNSVSLSHSSDKNSFRFSLSDMRGNDIVPNSTMSKTSLSLRAMQKFGKSIKIEASASYTMEKVNNRPALGDAATRHGLPPTTRTRTATTTTGTGIPTGSTPTGSSMKCRTSHQRTASSGRRSSHGRSTRISSSAYEEDSTPTTSAPWSTHRFPHRGT